MDDVLIIGGGVVGLSLAYELAGRGARVRVLERGEPGREASWAGAGMLPPALTASAAAPIDALARLSRDLHARWAAQLRETTGVDNGYRACGAVYVARDEREEAALAMQMNAWRACGIRVESIAEQQRGQSLPELSAASPGVRAAWLVPDEAQLRNPRHLKALVAGCVERGVAITSGAAVHDFVTAENRIVAARGNNDAYAAEQFCLTAGSWSGLVAERLGVRIGVRPVRGQMVLLAAPGLRLRRIVNEGPRYLVPRDDGRVLIGSTEEEAGFDCRTTACGVAGLLQFGLSLAPELAAATLERTWAGLRPGTTDGLPLLGRLPQDNGFIAAGHFRSGLQLSPATAVTMAQQILGEESSVDLSPFALRADMLPSPRTA